MKINACLASALLVAVAACGGSSNLPVSAGIGPAPLLPTPQQGLIPVINVVSASGWRATQSPVAAPGTVVRRFATGLDHPRWLYVLPNGDVLVAETNGPARPQDNRGVKGWVMKQYMKKAGSAVPSANRITLLRDRDGDGVVELRTVFLDNLNSPFGMALVGDQFYVANTDALMRFPYHTDATSIAARGTKVVDLPAGPINHHWTKNVIANGDGSKLYATVGSNSNIAENGLENEQGRAAIWEIDARTGSHRVFASGLRNPNGLAWESQSGKLWTTVNERDELGNDLVPDYMTSVRDGGFYGWPYSYFGAHVDTRVAPRPDLVSQALVPDYALGAHTASLGLVESHRPGAAERFPRGMFVAQHGSWNRKPRSGYKVIFVPFEGGAPAGGARDVLSGFVSEDGKAFGRPVGVAIDNQGALLVADDVGNTIWRLQSAAAQASFDRP